MDGRESKEKSTEDTHSAFISNITGGVCACSCMCDSQLFYANSHAEEGYSPKTCLELITHQTCHPDQHSSETVLNRTCDSQYNTKH